MINDGGKLGGCGCACKYSDLKRAESESWGCGKKKSRFCQNIFIWTLDS